MERRIFWLLSAAVVLLAYVVRDLYVAKAVLLHPFGGDAIHYIRYAHNIQLGYFGSGAAPDAYRPPGYPALIALTQVLGGDPYHRLLNWQVLMGATTVAFTIGLGRQWLPRWAALLAGLLLALWPHHIAFSAEVLSEVLAGFLLVAALLVAALAKDRAWAWACAGLLFAVGTLVNSVFAILPFLAASAMIGFRSPDRWLALFLPFAIVVGGWSMRPFDGGMDRAWQNLVQGSHPMYHDAYVRQFKDPRMAQITAQINDETAAMLANPSTGLRELASRLGGSPWHYLAWYAAKPWHLWDWDIGISPVGGPYMHEVQRSILDQPPLKQVTATFRAANPVLFILSLLFALIALRRPGLGRMVALAFLYFTAVHVVLQAEPRYSIPYRPVELLLAVSAIAAAARRLSRN